MPYACAAGNTGDVNVAANRMYTDIETLYTKTINLNPTCWMAYNNRGILYDGSQLQAGDEDLNEAIHLKADNDKSYYDRGLFMSNMVSINLPLMISIRPSD